MTAQVLLCFLGLSALAAPQALLSQGLQEKSEPTPLTGIESENGGEVGGGQLIPR